MGTSFPLLPLAGGVLIGLGSVLALLATGRIPGVSGVLSRALQGQAGDGAWRWLFLGGIPLGAALTFAWVDSAQAYSGLLAWPGLMVAGLLVGLGTRVGGGCTSGHGICGLGLGARSSLVATLTFMVAGAVTVWLLKHTAVAEVLR
jgi:hypothetical protein